MLDACLAFYSEDFAQCSALPLVQQAVGEAEHLDLNERPPMGWQALRAEAREMMEGAEVRTARADVG